MEAQGPSQQDSPGTATSLMSLPFSSFSLFDLKEPVLLIKKSGSGKNQWLNFGVQDYADLPIIFYLKVRNCTILYCNTYSLPFVLYKAAKHNQSKITVGSV